MSAQCLRSICGSWRVEAGLYACFRLACAVRTREWSLLYSVVSLSGEGGRVTVLGCGFKVFRVREFRGRRQEDF